VGLTEVRKKALDCLDKGQVLHEARVGGKVDSKNLLQIDKITIDEVKELINKTKGGQHTHSPHHLDKSIDVHVMKPVKDKVAWYIKFYFIEPNLIFISVHK
jgi:hypothetical protein